MQAQWLWWGVAVLLGVAELVTGTLYLLVVGLGFAAAGFLAVAGAGTVWQVLAAAVVSTAGGLILRRASAGRTRLPAQGNRDVHLDIGERVLVEQWQPDGRAQVNYRGASWAAELAPDEGGSPAPGEFVIRSIEGSRLVLARAR